MASCRIFDLKRFSINDGPGIRTSVFFKGCPLRCWWCHNPESQDFNSELFFFEDRCIGCGLCEKACEKKAISIEDSKPSTDRTLCDGCGDCEVVCPSRAREIAGRNVSTSKILEVIERDRPFYLESGGGVTFTGGEPLAQPEALAHLLKACKERGIHTAVDTCGYAPRDVISLIAKWTDLFLYDLKLADCSLHQEHTGAPNTLLLANLKELSGLGANIRVRIPVVPEVTSSNDNAVKIAGIIGALDVPVVVELLSFHRSAIAKYERLGKTPHPKWSMTETALINRMAKTFTDMGIKVEFRE